MGKDNQDLSGGVLNNESFHKEQIPRQKKSGHHHNYYSVKHNYEDNPNAT